MDDTRFALGLDGDGLPFHIGDELVWRNPSGEDDDERFRVRGCFVEGNGDMFAIDGELHRRYAGWCHRADGWHPSVFFTADNCWDCVHYARVAGCCECMESPMRGETVVNPRSFFCSDFDQRT